jgi:hypothetical protein
MWCYTSEVRLVDAKVLGRRAQAVVPGNPGHTFLLALLNSVSPRLWEELLPLQGHRTGRRHRHLAMPLGSLRSAVSRRRLTWHPAPSQLLQSPGWIVYDGPGC